MKTINDIYSLIEKREYDAIGINELDGEYSMFTPDRYIPYPLKDFINAHYNVQYDGNALMIFRVKV